MRGDETVIPGKNERAPMTDEEKMPAAFPNGPDDVDTICLTFMPQGIVKWCRGGDTVRFPEGATWSKVSVWLADRTSVFDVPLDQANPDLYYSAGRYGGQVTFAPHTRTSDADAWRSVLEAYVRAAFSADHVVADPAYLRVQGGFGEGPSLPSGSIDWLTKFYDRLVSGAELVSVKTEGKQ